MTRSRRAIFTYLTSVAFTAVTMVVGLVAIPYLLRWLGEERFGAYRAAADWYAHLILLELGIGGALYPLLAKALSRNERSALGATVSAGVRAYVRITAFMLLAGLVLAAGIPYVVPVDAALTGDLTRAALVAVVGLALTPLIPFRQLWEARQEGYRVNLLLLVQSLLITAVALLLAYAGWGITGQMVALVFGGYAFYFVLVGREARERPWLVKAVTSRVPDAEAWSELWKLNRPTVTRQMCGRISVASDRIIVAAMLGPVMVVPLFVTQRLVQLAQQQVQSIGSAAWAGLAELDARGERETFNARLVELTQMVTALGIAVLVPIVAYNEHFVSLWVGGQRYAGDLVTAAAGAGAILLAVVTLWDWAFEGTGRVARLVPVTIVSTVINLALSIALIPRYGVAGPLLGTLVAVSLTSAWYVPLLLKRDFDLRLGALLRATLIPIAWGVVFFPVAWRLAHSRASLGWAALALEMSAAVTAYLLVWWLAMLTPGQRRMNLERMRALFAKAR